MKTVKMLSDANCIIATTKKGAILLELHAFAHLYGGFEKALELHGLLGSVYKEERPYREGDIIEVTELTDEDFNTLEFSQQVSLKNLNWECGCGPSLYGYIKVPSFKVIEKPGKNVSNWTVAEMVCVEPIYRDFAVLVDQQSVFKDILNGEIVIRKDGLEDYFSHFACDIHKNSMIDTPYCRVYEHGADYSPSSGVAIAPIQDLSKFKYRLDAYPTHYELVHIESNKVVYKEPYKEPYKTSNKASNKTSNSHTRF